MMPAGSRKKHRWTVIVAILVAICFFYASRPLADEGVQGKDAQALENSATSTEETAPPPVEASGAPVWEGTSGDKGVAGSPAPEEQAVVEESPPAVEPKPEEAGTAPADGSQLSFDVGGLTLGMDLNDAKVAFDQILGFESTVVQKETTDQIELDGSGYATVTGDKDMRVIRMQFGSEFIDVVYRAEGLKVQDFAKKFSDIYHIEMALDITRRHVAWEYASPDGVTVTISSSERDDKTLTVEKK